MSNMKQIIFNDYRIHYGLNELLKSDKYLLKNSLSERCISHKLAEHYQKLFFEWNVDCEYNKNLSDPKRIYLEPEEILQAMANFLEEKGYEINLEEVEYSYTHSFRKIMRNLEKQLRDKERIEYIKELDLVLFKLEIEKDKHKWKLVYPDIIVHQRGTINNHIVIEVKKSDNDTLIERAYDMLKLTAMTNQPHLNYNFGYFIDIPVGKDFEKFTQFSKSKNHCQKVYKILPEYKSNNALKELLRSRNSE